LATPRAGAVLLVLIVTVAAAGVRAVGAQPAAAPELRALWVDAFHAGIRSPAEAAQLVVDAKRIHVNTLIVQVRRRGDTLYTGGLEPSLDDPGYQPSFDALAHVIAAAHAAGLQMQAWINALPDRVEIVVTAGSVARVALDRDGRRESY
jgi:uncharacterized lipoprotein YddW (UPF0748 family)